LRDWAAATGAVGWDGPERNALLALPGSPGGTLQAAPCAELGCSALSA